MIQIIDGKSKHPEIIHIHEGRPYLLVTSAVAISLSYILGDLSGTKRRVYYTTEELAYCTQVSKRTIQFYREQKLIKTVSKGKGRGHTFIYPEQTIKDILIIKELLQYFTVIEVRRIIRLIRRECKY